MDAASYLYNFILKNPYKKSTTKNLLEMTTQINQKTNIDIKITFNHNHAIIFAFCQLFL